MGSLSDRSERQHSCLRGRWVGCSYALGRRSPGAPRPAGQGRSGPSHTSAESSLTQPRTRHSDHMS